MTATLVQIPLAIGAGALQVAGWACAWSAERFLRSPMAATGLILASGLTLLAGTNALFMQDARHPAPLFVAGGTGASQQAAAPAPIAPVVVEPEAVPQRPAAEPSSAEPVSQPQAVASVSEAEPAPRAVGNRDIAEMQEKLQAMGLFDGTVDGFYGPKTADAIRAFEARFNMPRTGAATPQVLQAVREAPINGAAASAPAPAPVQPMPEPAAVAAAPEADEAGVLIAQMQEEAFAAPAVPDELRVVSDVAPQETVQAASVQVAAAAIPAALDTDLVGDIQRGLARLGFLQGPVNGVADEATARAIRQFQIFNNFVPTGEVSPMVRDMLVAAGAYI